MANSESSGVPIVNDTGLRQAVQQYVTLDDRLRKVSAQVAPIRKTHRVLKQSITGYMERTKRDTCYFNEGREQICITPRMTKVKLDDDAYRARLARALNGDDKAADRVFEFTRGEGVEREQTKNFGRKLSKYGLRANRTPAKGPGEAKAVESMKLAEVEMSERIRSGAAFQV
jgi:hypothetical protein